MVDIFFVYWIENIPKHFCRRFCC